MDENEMKVDTEETCVRWNYIKDEPIEDAGYEEENEPIVKEENLNIDVNKPIHTGEEMECDGVIAIDETIVKPNNINEPREIKIEFDDTISDTSLDDDECDCNGCSTDYEGFCSKCSNLTHILNSNISQTNSEWKSKSISSGVLEIRDTLDEKSVFALKNIPENVMLGPFEGVSPIETSDAFMWGIEDGKLSNLQNGNWMQYINCVASASANNLDVFQFEGDLYYQTNREIGEGEELLVYFRKEEIQKSKNSEDNCFIPMLVKESQKVFACTLCCLGFKLVEGLIKHKEKCRHSAHDGNISEIIQCYYCNVWLDENEYLEQHVLFCQDNCSRIGSFPMATDRSKIDIPMDIERKTRGNYMNVARRSHKLRIKKPFKCTHCAYETNRKSSLQKHIKSKHSAGIDKDFKCTHCLYKTNRKSTLQSHIKAKHSAGIDKDFKCIYCLYETNKESNLQSHIKRRHSAEIDFKCTHCSYETNMKSYLKKHIKRRHSAGIDFKCTHCSYETNMKSNLESHIKHKHSAGIYNKKFQMCRFLVRINLEDLSKESYKARIEKDFKCVQCLYETSCRSNLQKHIKGKHSAGIEKDFKCTHCLYETNWKSDLQKHIKRKHSEEIERDFKHNMK